MMSPQEAENHGFSKASFGGYNMGQVDKFLDTLIADYSALYKENAVLKGKMKKVADKLEEYRETENEMRRTLRAAQQMAQQMVKEAEERQKDVINRAQAETKIRLDEIHRELANEEIRLVAAKNSTITYVEKLKELYTHELEYISNLSDMTMETSGESAALDPVKEIEERVASLLSATKEEMANEKAEASYEAPEEEGEEEEDGSTKLDFGKDYELK